ncbi:MAG: hypothetical protein ABIO72_05535 [Patescibacteria group bacterium]
MSKLNLKKEEVVPYAAALEKILVVLREEAPSAALIERTRPSSDRGTEMGLDAEEMTLNWDFDASLKDESPDVNFSLTDKSLSELQIISVLFCNGRWSLELPDDVEEGTHCADFFKKYPTKRKGRYAQEATALTLVRNIACFFFTKYTS